MRDLTLPILGLGLLVAIAACGDKADSGGEPDGGDTGSTDVSDASSDAPDTNADTTPACPERLAVCDALDTPLEASISRGVVGAAVYESDVVLNECEPECGAASVDFRFFSTHELVTRADQARLALAEAAGHWETSDGTFELEAGSGPHLFCIQAVGQEGDFAALCAGLDFDEEALYTVVLKSQFGPAELYVVRHSDGWRVPVFELELE